jgi:hypothetical protein
VSEVFDFSFNFDFKQKLASNFIKSYSRDEKYAGKKKYSTNSFTCVGVVTANHFTSTYY